MSSLDRRRWWYDKEMTDLVTSIQSLAGAGRFFHGQKFPSTRTSDHFLLIFVLLQLLVITGSYSPSIVLAQNRSPEVMRTGPLNPDPTLV